MSDMPIGDQPLPPGLHPRDPSVGWDGSQPAGFDGNPVTGPEPGQTYQTGRKPYNRENYEALPVFERASDDWSARIMTVTAADTATSGTALVVGRQDGRKSVTLSVPTLLPSGVAPLGVVIGPSESDVQAGGSAGYLLNVGDSITIYTEAPVWCATIPGNASGAVQFIAEFNPPGGGLTQ